LRLSERRRRSIAVLADIRKNGSQEMSFAEHDAALSKEALLI
jgi:hypothetical protein